ncbi:MAG: uroporphyrinogen decarboxylase family protein [Pirellulales bacterium]|nr:uroporphyrinogen decarboxylase family protein [Pirellulales bacterium]
MTGLERTLAFIQGKSVDRAPFHPIVMRWAAKYAGVKYRDFCLDYRAKCIAMLRAAEDFGHDWVTVMSDPYAEASAFGIKVEYPDDSLPLDKGGRLPDLAAAGRLQPVCTLDHPRMVNRLEEIREFRRRAGVRFFIVGWVEGPVAEYADLRGTTTAAMDLLDDPETVARAMDVITESAIEFITHQIEAGAHCVGIGDAFCSQIGPANYRRFAWEREKRMIDLIHRLGALAKLHICGNTRPIVPEMIATGADIIDVDHLVPSMAEFAPLLGERQVFSGKVDPVSVIQNGDAARIAAEVRHGWEEARGRAIVSAGCEITPGTSVENMRAFENAARSAK